MHMASPAGPIYASTLHRRDRAWGVRRRARTRGLVWSAALASVAAMALSHFV